VPGVTATGRLRYADYDDTVDVPNIVVDGSANAATVLTLSHWPGAPTPSELQRDLSAGIAFAYLDHPCPHDPADVVTNNHFDQDGLVSVAALVDPAADDHRQLLIDVAAAGDFGTYRDRRAARASIVIARWSDAGWGYRESLPHLIDLALDPEPYRELWEDEDAHLTASEQAIDTGMVTIEERPELDLAIVTVSPGAPDRLGHRFAHETVAGLHPIAIHNATDRFRLLVLAGRRYRYVDRYETWVQFRSRPTLRRVDMRPLAAELSERDQVPWTAGAPSQLTPEMTHAGESTFEPRDFVDAVVDRLTGIGISRDAGAA
jgi:hypothetical protein